jgi:hypothetical protein
MSGYSSDECTQDGAFHLTFSSFELESILNAKTNDAVGVGIILQEHIDPKNTSSPGFKIVCQSYYIAEIEVVVVSLVDNIERLSENVSL